MAAASDKPYRNQRMLDVFFGVSCVLMLASLVWMFYDDQYRDWKKEQRNFRNVEEAMAQRGLLALAPDDAKLVAIETAQEAVYRSQLTLARKKALVHGQADEIRKNKGHCEALLETIRPQYEAARKEKEQAEEEARKAQEALKAARATLETATKDPALTKAQEAVKEAQKNLDAAKSQKEPDEKKVKELDQKLKDAEKALKPLQDKVSEADATVKKLDQKVKDAEAKLNQAKEVDDRNTRRWAAAQALITNADEDLKAVGGYIKTPVDTLLATRAKNEQRFNDIKADLDARVSDFDIAVDKRNAATDASTRASLESEVKRLEKDVAELKDRLQKAQNEVDDVRTKLAQAMEPQTNAEKELSDAEDNLKVLTSDFDRFHKLVEQKRWGTGDWFRALPVIDAFASPIKIQQYTLDELTIDYSFKRVTRYDRCTTCHLGIDRPTYDKQSLRDLALDPTEESQKLDERRRNQLQLLEKGKHLTYEQKVELDELNRRIARRSQLLTQLKNARTSLTKRQQIAHGSGFNPDDLKLGRLPLTETQINEYCVHPRLELFVDGNSPHSAEKFGCTICHAGQGSSTSFQKAAHTPDNATQKKRWSKELGWEHDHMWDFPMLPNRFIESSCVKCHYQITDTIKDGSKAEAPKLLKGYNLVKDNGCFGCHEIAGIKGGRQVGPDLRLEPTPPLDAYTPSERAKQFSDPLNPPGAMRKVGPSLRRVSEKTNEKWLKQWIKSPRDFRPDTKMPHFYGLSNNNHEALKGTGQEAFPDAEINSIAYYLLEESQAYLRGTDRFREGLKSRQQGLLKKLQTNVISEKESTELAEINRRLELYTEPVPLSKLLPELPAEPTGEKERADQQKRGRELFSEKGCLACHINNNTATPGKDGVPALVSDSHFGPNLTRLAAKLGNGEKDSARRWLVQWIMNPTIYHPRTFMPITHLEVGQANDVASWLLAQKTDWKGPEVGAPDTETLKKLARVFLERAYAPSRVNQLLDKGFSDDQVKDMRFDQDERELHGSVTDPKLKRYIGKKAITNMGCFACHDIPGFEYAKPIGTPLNEWGKKDAERLAFEDAAAYVRKTSYITERLVEKDGKAPGIKDGKTPYEKYFYDSLEHHQREGFLHQKLREPRSYDYDRIRAWDDRLRMPQFKFARTEQRKGETDDAFQARSLKEEAEAREAVMTFILGLVAEPIAPKYVYNPTPEKLAEAKGRHVLDKFNCNSCHLVRPGVYEFKVTAGSLNTLMQSHGIANAKAVVEADHRFPEHNAWAGTNPTRPDKLTAYGIKPTLLPDPKSGNQFMLQLTHALRFQGKDAQGKEMMLDIPAYGAARVLEKDVISRSEAYGGTFGNLLVSYLVAKDKVKYPADIGDEDAPVDSAKARPAVPPALLRQGEKTQPNWLYQFLKNPEPIRPAVVLRMPKFNMSDEDALALVNYFAAADRISNPGVGLHYPYFSIPERDDAYITSRTASYIDRLLKETEEKDKDGKVIRKYKPLDDRVKELSPIWGVVLQDQVNEQKLKQKVAEERIKEAKAALDKEPDAEKKKPLAALHESAIKEKELVDKQLQSLEESLKKKDFTPLRKQWEGQEAYLNDAFRLVANQNLCLTCHQVGSIEPKERQGPPLALAWQRLRPEYTERWLANPQRFMTYSSPMPINFPAHQLQYQESFVGTSRQQVTAARDFLMNFPRAMDLPVNRNRPLLPLPPPGGN